jgi:hypothetical protein
MTITPVGGKQFHPVTVSISDIVRLIENEARVAELDKGRDYQELFRDNLGRA